MNESVSMSQPAPRPSMTGSFFHGFRTGGINGGMMLGLYSAVALGLKATGIAVFGGLGFMGWPLVAVTVLTTGLFSGVMAAKKSMSSHGVSQSHSQSISNSPALVPVMGQSMVPQLDMAQSAEAATEQPAGSWVSRTGRGSESQSRIDQILADGAMSDKGRALSSPNTKTRKVLPQQSTNKSNQCFVIQSKAKELPQSDGDPSLRSG